MYIVAEIILIIVEETFFTIKNSKFFALLLEAFILNVLECPKFIFNIYSLHCRLKCPLYFYFFVLFKEVKFSLHGFYNFILRFCGTLFTAFICPCRNKLCIIGILFFRRSAELYLYAEKSFYILHAFSFFNIHSCIIPFVVHF